MPTDSLGVLHRVLDGIPERIVACSGGVDSLLLATVAHRAGPDSTVVAHAVTAAVPPAATERTVRVAAEEGWDLRLVETGEFGDDRYLANPADRCYFCKSHLYDRLDALALDLVAAAGDGSAHAVPPGWTLLSGANVDDLAEYRPGLTAAAEHGVRHPYVEGGIAKLQIRAMAASLGLEFSELPAAPCLASRLYTGTQVTPARLRAIDAGEVHIRRATGIEVVRCRMRQDQVVIEVGEGDRALITEALLDEVRAVMVVHELAITSVHLDEQPYRPGRAIKLSAET